MKREWITDINRMNFTEEEKEIVEKVFNADPSMSLEFDGKTYMWETESDTDYFNKEVLLENVFLTYEEWKKEGVFDEEEEAPAEEPKAEEPKAEEVCITYQTTASGCKAFVKDMWSDIDAALDKGGEGLPTPTLILGNRQIQLIDCPLTYEGIQALIEDMVEEYLY